VEATILGSGGWIPTGRRETTSVLVRRGDRALLLDAGTGARRLVGGDLLHGVARLDVVLTHFHLDHVCGLAYLPALATATRIWAPGRWLYGRPSAELLAPLLAAPALARYQPLHAAHAELLNRAGDAAAAAGAYERAIALTANAVELAELERRLGALHAG
jgi:ribonuclease BN (tRNA processing enzyme)